MSFILSNFIIKFKNSHLIGKKSMFFNYSYFIESIVKALKYSGFVKDYCIVERLLFIRHKYLNKSTLFRNISVISKPGVRRYIKCFEYSLYDVGTYFISTNKGILTSDIALKMKLGGELIFVII